MCVYGVCIIEVEVVVVVVVWCGAGVCIYIFPPFFLHWVLADTSDDGRGDGRVGVYNLVKPNQSINQPTVYTYRGNGIGIEHPSLPKRRKKKKKEKKKKKVRVYTYLPTYTGALWLSGFASLVYVYGIYISAIVICGKHVCHVLRARGFGDVDR